MTPDQDPDETEPEPACGNCMFWLDREGPSGLCRLTPQTYNKTWDQWCGEHES